MCLLEGFRLVFTLIWNFIVEKVKKATSGAQNWNLKRCKFLVVNLVNTQYVTTSPLKNGLRHSYLLKWAGLNSAQPGWLNFWPQGGGRGKPGKRCKGRGKRRLDGQ